MNSLEQLNSFSSQGVDYQDQRDYVITFTPATPVNQTVAITEGAQFTSAVGTNITEMFSTPGPMYYTIDLSSITFPVLFTWQNTPPGVSAEIIATKVYRMAGFIGPEVWDLIKNPLIQIYDQGTNFSYTASISYLNPADTTQRLTKSWTVSVTVTDTLELSEPGSYTYVKNIAGVIDNEPQIVDTTPNATYSLTVTPSSTVFVSTMSSAGSGGTSSFNGVTKVLTLTGTKTQINSHLNSITFNAATNQIGTFLLYYSLVNNITGLTTTVSQSMIGSANGYRINAGTFLEDTPFNPGISIVDGSATATSFTFTIVQTAPNPTTSPGFFTVNGSNVGTSWSITNSKATINAANVQYNPPLDYQADLGFAVSLSKIDNGNTVVMATNDPVTIYNAGTNPEVSNIVPRTYLSHQDNMIFATQTPYINDGPDLGQTYTINLSSTVGNFGNSYANAILSNTYSFSGNMTTVNNLFPNLLFIPVPGVPQTGTYTYAQQRNGVNQTSITQPMTGVTGGNITPQTVTVTANSTYNFSTVVSYYGDIQILTVAGGAGGGGVGANPLTRGNTASGGGGQARLINASRTLTPGTYDIIVGSSGSAGTPQIGSNAATATNAQPGGDSYMTLQGGDGSKKVWSQGGRPTNIPPYTGQQDNQQSGQSYATYDIPGDGTDTFHLPGYFAAGGVGNSSSSQGVFAGGGAGTGSNIVGTLIGDGGNGYQTTIFSGSPAVASNIGFSSGNGGAGLVSNITGSNIMYGSGAAGGLYVTVNESNVANSIFTSGSSNGGGYGVQTVNSITNVLPTPNRGGGGQGRKQRVNLGAYNIAPQAGATGVIVLKIT
jgi:hypothetical protein